MTKTSLTPEEIRQLREGRDESITEFAAALHVTEAAARRWEDGTSVPNPSNMYILQGLKRTLERKRLKEEAARESGATT